MIFCWTPYQRRCQTMQLMDIANNLPAEFPFDTLMARFLNTHTLLDQEDLDVLFKMERLGSLKPSQRSPLGSYSTFWTRFLVGVFLWTPLQHSLSCPTRLTYLLTCRAL
jgi:hypothetical protein